MAGSFAPLSRIRAGGLGAVFEAHGFTWGRGGLVTRVLFGPGRPWADFWGRGGVPPGRRVPYRPSHDPRGRPFRVFGYGVVITARVVRLINSGMDSCGTTGVAI